MSRREHNCSNTSGRISIPLSAYREEAFLRERLTSRALSRVISGHEGWRERVRVLDSMDATDRVSDMLHIPNVQGIQIVAPDEGQISDTAKDLTASLLQAGLKVTVISRQSPEDWAHYHGDSRFLFVEVPPLSDYSRHVDPELPVICFSLWVSASLVLAGIKHSAFVIPDLDCHDLNVLGDIIFLPDRLFSCEGGEVLGRRFFALSSETLMQLLGTVSPPYPENPHLPRLSACIIARDEEGMIEDCLISLVPVADEVIVNDTGSVDSTKEIARAFGAKVVESRWKNDFSDARNRSIQEATGDYILVIDADERIASGNHLELKERIASGGWEGLEVRIRSSSDNARFSHGFVTRVFRNAPSHRYIGKVHEQIAHSIRGTIAKSEVTFDHLGYDPAVSLVKNKRKRNISLLLYEHKQKDSPRDDHYLAFQSGSEALFSGNYRDSLEALLRVYRETRPHAPYRPYAAHRACHSMVALGMIDQAVALARDAIRQYPGFVEIAQVAAGGLMSRKRYNDALLVLTEASTSRPHPGLPKTEGADTYRLQCMLAEVKIGLGQTEEAFSHIRSSLFLNPDWDISQRVLVRYWEGKAIMVLREVGAKKVRPASLESIYRGNRDLAWEIALAFDDPGAVGEVLLCTRDYEGAAASFLRSNEEWDVMRAELLERCGLCKRSAGAGRFRVVERLLSGQKTAVGDIPYVGRIIGFLLDLRAMSQLQAVRRSLEHYSEGPLLFAKTLFDKGYLELARSVLEESGIRNHESLSILCQISFLRGQHRNAVKYSEELESLRHLSPDEYIRFVTSLVNEGQVAVARCTLDRAMELYPKHERLSEVRALLK